MSNNNGYLIDNISVNIRIEITIFMFPRVMKTLAYFNVNEKHFGLHEH